MTTLTDEQILKIFKGHMTDKRDVTKEGDDFRPNPPEFSLEDVVGKTICGQRELEHPPGYIPGETNPPYFHVLEFLDCSILLTELFEKNGSHFLNSYLFDGKEVLYSATLFNPYLNIHHIYDKPPFQGFDKNEGFDYDNYDFD